MSENIIKRAIASTALVAIDVRITGKKTVAKKIWSILHALLIESGIHIDSLNNE